MDVANIQKNIQNNNPKKYVDFQMDVATYKFWAKIQKKIQIFVQ